MSKRNDIITKVAKQKAAQAYEDFVSTLEGIQVAGIDSHLILGCLRAVARGQNNPPQDLVKMFASKIGEELKEKYGLDEPQIEKGE